MGSAGLASCSRRKNARRPGDAAAVSVMGMVVRVTVVVAVFMVAVLVPGAPLEAVAARLGLERRLFGRRGQAQLAHLPDPHVIVLVSQAVGRHLQGHVTVPQ